MKHDQAETATPAPLFAIHIVESPSAEDFYNGREEGAALEECLDLMEVSSRRYQVISEQFLVRAAAKIAARHGPEGRYEGRVPIVHISCHGNETGIGLTAAIASEVQKDFTDFVAHWTKKKKQEKEASDAMMALLRARAKPAGEPSSVP